MVQAGPTNNPAVFRVAIPIGISPGEQFLTDCEGEKVWVLCPEGVGEGDEVQFILPDKNLERLVIHDDVREMFNTFDLDHDGRLDVKELHNAFNELGFDESEAKMLIEEGDVNRDGAINLAEFNYLYATLKSKIVHKKCEEMRIEHEKELENLKSQLERQETKDAAEELQKSYEKSKNSMEETLKKERNKQRKKLEEKLKARRTKTNMNIPGQVKSA